MPPVQERAIRSEPNDSDGGIGPMKRELMNAAVDEWAARRLSSSDLAAIFAFLWFHGGREEWVAAK
jgi:hypothetical protein